jgi:hypothetical protein
VNTGLTKYLLLLTTLFLAIPSFARTHKPVAKPDAPSDPGYVFALAAATHFLHAWQTADLESGMVLLSDGIRHSRDAEQLEQFFSSGTGRGFEIARGHGHHALYSFPVVMVTLRGNKVARKASEITLIETGKNDWVVDRLP